jgi:peptidoglycan/LPS O-acetylase OafA/YrhL
MSIKSVVTFPQKNNFDLLRLFAALQVAVVHGYEHFQLKGLNVVADFMVQKIVVYFPGVPIFFAMSGFLIFSSFDRRKNLRVYCVNRFLRLFPGLWVSFLLTFSILCFFRYITFGNLLSGNILFWIAGQVSCFQFFTPGALRGYGLGNPNGSLWTIFVEIQYYALVPVLHYLFRKLRPNWNIFLLILISGSLLANVILGTTVESGSIIGKLISVTLLPYLFYFLLGAMVYLNYERLSRFVENRALMAGSCYFLFYIIVSLIAKLYYPGYWVNTFGFINSLLLTWFVFALAFSNMKLSHKLLRENDLSYGLYIYHGIVLNFFIHKKFPFSFSTLAIYLLVSIALAFFSWKLIEHPTLKLKKTKGDDMHNKLVQNADTN